MAIDDLVNQCSSDVRRGDFSEGQDFEPLRKTILHREELSVAAVGNGGNGGNSPTKSMETCCHRDGVEVSSRPHRHDISRSIVKESSNIRQH